MTHGSTILSQLLQLFPWQRDSSQFRHPNMINWVGVSEIYKLVMDGDIQIDLGNGKGERSQKTSLGKIRSSLRDRQIGEYRVVHAGSKDNGKL